MISTLVVTGLISWLSNTVPDQSILPAHSLASSYNTPPLILAIVFNVISTTLMAGSYYASADTRDKSSVCLPRRSPYINFRHQARNNVRTPQPTGPVLHPNHFTNIAHILTESCALLTAASLVYMALPLANHPGVYILVTLLPQVQIISALLVLLRISQGIAWGTTSEELSVGRFVVDLDRVRVRLEDGSSDRGKESAGRKDGTSVGCVPAQSLSLDNRRSDGYAKEVVEMKRC
ncbi:hypothetical protein CONPUDRAFT_159667 [Coniophora puteana RWD-64-598 SS2]|uniref:Uncharacterized protein n=1 Tax=Coniophora puteana (strain RWD-64-598) TaxID=741705 RepID=A0A5M3M767_CONPW|nr:uncharacterized protein CONPUDRAFT_159667 [Coniophora puteana RWD-64-598 SS2]EIW74893.1 hypothetical protein CONPUDRAFT_159667 [Coniophora puteana RWD-64-598 SS2]